CSINRCGKRFRYPKDLERHLRSHYHQRLFKCDRYHWRPKQCRRGCQKTFAETRDLGRHELTHTKERAHQCPYCTYAAARKDQLDRHKRS
ncbi:hypothetical protein K431DRAFT_196809, partial [Polychaeton citri CBS 116435]